MSEIGAPWSLPYSGAQSICSGTTPSGKVVACRILSVSYNGEHAVSCHCSMLATTQHCLAPCLHLYCEEPIVAFAIHFEASSVVAPVSNGCFTDNTGSSGKIMYLRIPIMLLITDVSLHWAFATSASLLAHCREDLAVSALLQELSLHSHSSNLPLVSRAIIQLRDPHISNSTSHVADGVTAGSGLHVCVH